MESYLFWFLIGFGFIIAELALPGVILIFFGFGAWITAVLVYFVNPDKSIQIAVFLVSSIITLLLLRKIGIKTFKGQTNTTKDDDFSNAANGQTAVVTREVGPLLPGEIKFRGSFWRAVCSKRLSPGTVVVIEGKLDRDESVFQVMPVVNGGQHAE